MRSQNLTTRGVTHSRNGSSGSWRRALDDRRRGQKGGEPPVVNLAITGANSGVGNIFLRHLAGRTDIHVVACVRSARAAATLRAAPGISVREIDYDDRDRLTAALRG